MAYCRSLLATALTLGVIAAPVAAARPSADRHRHAPAPMPRIASVTVHRGSGFRSSEIAGGPQIAEAGAPWFGDAAGPGYWEANYGREDDAALFARRYGCARPIWNAKSNRYMPACN